MPIVANGIIPIPAAVSSGLGRKSAKNEETAEIPPVMAGISALTAADGGKERALDARLTDCGRGGGIGRTAVVRLSRNFFTTLPLTAEIYAMLPPSSNP